MLISIFELGEFFKEFGIYSRIASLLQSVASRADAFVRQHIPSQTPLSLLVLFPAAHDHCSIDFPSLRQALWQALFYTTPLGDFHVGEVGWISLPFLYKADYGSICISTLAFSSSLDFPLPQNCRSLDIAIAAIIRHYEIPHILLCIDLCIGSCSYQPTRKMSCHSPDSPNWSTSAGHPLASLPIANLSEMSNPCLFWQSVRDSHAQRQMHPHSLRHPCISSKQDMQSDALPW
jgi:hypothetical protein